MAYSISIRLCISDDLRADAPVSLSREQSHYLVNVMRQGTGASVLLFNGRDGEWRAEITDADKKSCVLTSVEQTKPQSEEPDVWLLFAPLKKDRTDFVVEKATELGVSELHPVLTERTQTKRVNVERLQATATEAAEQSHRLHVPTVRDAKRLSDALADWPSKRALVHLDENGTGAPLANVLIGKTAAPLAFLIGPEGGFSEAEVETLAQHPAAIAADLGPRILRAETAATTALAIRQGVADMHI